MLLHNDSNGEQAHNFKWGIKKGVGRTNKDLHFYKSFTYHGMEYSLYDCAYFHKIGAAETYIGKLVKIYETPGHEKKVKVVWFFHPFEIRNFLGDYEPRWNEVFLASGEGKGLSNINPLESIVQKCNVVCASHDKRNPQATEQELRLADYIFYFSFDVGECKIQKNFADRIDGIKVEHFFNKLKDQKVISQPILKPNVKVEGHAVRDGKSSSSCPVVKASEEVAATLGEQEGISNGNAILKPKTPINGPGPSKILCSQVDDKAKNVRSGDSSTWDASNIQPHKKRKLLQDEREDTISNKVGLQVAKDRGAKTVIEVKLARRPDADKRQWFKQLNWDYLIRTEDYFTAKIGSHIGDEVIGNLKSNLSESQLGLFRKTCFGHFLDLPEFKFQAQLVHCLLLRELKQPVENELWVGVQGCRLRFSIEEFAVVTGLNCIGDCNKLSFVKENNSLISKYFGGVKRINKQSIEELFLSRRWDSDEDALKIAVLYFIHLFLLSSPKEKIVSKDYLDIVDGGSYNDYPWGKEVFYVTLESLKRKLHGKQNRGASIFYRLIGFPLAFQVWFFECCPYVVGKLAVLVGDSVPRILNWSSSSIPSYKILHNGLFSESAKKLKLRNITPTAAERRELKLDEFFGKGKGDAFVAEDGKFDDDDDDHDEDFESPGPPKKVAASTSKQSERSRFDGDGSSFEVEEMRKKLKKVCSRQKKLSKDFSSLKYFLEKKFAEVFDTFSVLQSKLQTDRTSVDCKDFEVVDNDDKDDKEIEKDSDNEDERNYDGDKEDDEEDNGDDGGGGVGGDDDGKGGDSAGKVDFDGGSGSCADGVEKKASVEKFDDERDDFDCNLLGHIDQATTFSKLVEESIASKPVLVPVNECKEIVPYEGLVVDSSLLVSPYIKKRKMRPTFDMRFPFFNEFDSSESGKEPMGSKTVLSGLSPLDDNVGEPPNFKDQQVFDLWLDYGMKKSNKRKLYSVEDNFISPPLNFGVDSIYEKMWFYSLQYGGQLLSSSHIDVLFYYLRKKGKYSSSCQVIFTTTDNLFDQRIQNLYASYLKKGKDVSVVLCDDLVAEYVLGFYMHCNTPWVEVDHILFPVHIKKDEHWVLARFSFKERCIFVYNSLRSAKNDKVVAQAIEPYSILLPYVMLMLGVFGGRQDLDTGIYGKKGMIDPFDVQMVDGLPTQVNNDCGIFVFSFAEYFVLGKKIPSTNFNIEIHRSRLAVLLYSYAKRKESNGVESESEFPGKFRHQENLKKKRKRKGKKVL